MSGCAPDSALTFFASPKKVSKERRAGFVGPSLRYGHAALLGLGGVWLELAALKQSPALIRPNLRYSPPHYGVESKYRQPDTKVRTSSALRADGYSSLLAERSDGLCSPNPFCMRRGAQGATDQDWRLFEPKASSSQAPSTPSTAGCPEAQRRGRRQQGRLSFGDFSLAKQRKVTALSGAQPDMPKHQIIPPKRI